VVVSGVDGGEFKGVLLEIMFAEEVAVVDAGG